MWDFDGGEVRKEEGVALVDDEGCCEHVEV